MDIGSRIYLTNTTGADYEAVEQWVRRNSESSTLRFNSDVSDTGDLCVVSVDVIEAHHCPGACMFLFSMYHWKASSAELFFTTLYTGDFRNMNDLIQSTILKEYTLTQNRCIDHIYLDNTYCDKKYDFPPQSAVVNTVIHILKKYYLDAIQKKQACGLRLMDREKEKLLKCYADYESEYQPWITTDLLSTSFLLADRFHL